MNLIGIRINGGVGFSINDPVLQFTFTKSETFRIIDDRKKTFSESEKNRVYQRIAKLTGKYDFQYTIECRIISEIPTHSGFGSSTALNLACIEALFLVNNYTYSNELIISESGRGGTSGIGINTYFEGGFVFDIGKKRTNEIKLKPSSQGEKRIILPLKILRLDMPQWQFGICIPKTVNPKSENEEKLFFDKVVHLTENEVNEIISEIILKLIPGIIENDLLTFCKSVNKIQNTPWKSQERQLYGAELTNIENRLLQLGAKCVGMSSLGPSLFFVCNNFEQIKSGIIASKLDCEIYSTFPNNSGRKIIYE